MPLRAGISILKCFLGNNLNFYQFLRIVKELSLGMMEKVQQGHTSVSVLTVQFLGHTKKMGRRKVAAGNLTTRNSKP